MSWVPVLGPDQALLKVLLVMNDYFHDVATALLLASAVIMWVLGRAAERGGPGEAAMLRRAFPVLTRFAWGAIAWIVIGGIPRTIFFSQLEWDPAKTRFMLPALMVKHSLMVVAVVLGVALWRRMARAASDDGGAST
ncbi:MAG: hypothetical protein WC971_06460 [Coriobacteriia bacterium]